MTTRQAFEAFITAPPFEMGISRFDDRGAWPGSYKSYETDLAWQSWQAATDAERLAQSLSECSNRLTLRVSCADAPHQVLMQWNDAESGWRDARGEPA